MVYQPVDSSLLQTWHDLNSDNPNEKAENLNSNKAASQVVQQATEWYR